MVLLTGKATTVPGDKNQNAEGIKVDLMGFSTNREPEKGLEEGMGGHRMGNMVATN